MSEAITAADYPVGLLARISSEPETLGRIVGMQSEWERHYSDGTVVSLTAQGATFDGIARLLHPDDRAALLAALLAVQP